MQLAVDVRRRLVAVEVLAHQGRPVAATLEAGGERVPLLAARVEEREPTVIATVGEDARVVRILAGEGRRTRGAAEGVGDDVVRERRAPRPQLSDVRHVLDQVPGQVVGEDEDDVRPLGRRSAGVRAAREGESDHSGQSEQRKCPVERLERHVGPPESSIRDDARRIPGSARKRCVKPR